MAAARLRQYNGGVGERPRFGRRYALARSKRELERRTIEIGRDNASAELLCHCGEGRFTKRRPLGFPSLPPSAIIGCSSAKSCDAMRAAQQASCLRRSAIASSALPSPSKVRIFPCNL